MTNEQLKELYPIGSIWISGCWYYFVVAVEYPMISFKAPVGTLDKDYRDIADTFSRVTNAVNPHALEVAQQIKESVKLDAGKAPWHLLPVEAMEDLVDVFNYGLAEYGPRNWEHPGFDYSRLFSATMRHMWAWWGGEDTCKKSGKKHLVHAASNILFLLQYSHSGAGKDDRP